MPRWLPRCYIPYFDLIKLIRLSSIIAGTPLRFSRKRVVCVVALTWSGALPLFLIDSCLPAPLFSGLYVTALLYYVILSSLMDGSAKFRDWFWVFMDATMLPV